MDAGRAIKLSQGALVGERRLTPEQIRQRVSSRYPLAAALPGRLELGKLLIDAGLELDWNGDLPGGGAFVSTARNVLSVSDVSSTPPRFSTGARPAATAAPSFQPAYKSPELVEAECFEERLRWAEREGAFLALTVNRHAYDLALQALTRLFATQPLDLERTFLDALHEATDEVGADWDVVVAADAADPRSEDWRNLNHLIASRVIPKVEQTLIRGDPGVKKTVLTYQLNWLQRYGQVVMLSRVAQAVQEGRLHGAWLLIPASPQTEMPLLDGAAVPVITNNQWAHIPESWCQNLHRAEVS
jgi:hypothetical protein